MYVEVFDGRYVACLGHHSCTHLPNIDRNQHLQKQPFEMPILGYHYSSIDYSCTAVELWLHTVSTPWQLISLR